jgi:hypothetical protein
VISGALFLLLFVSTTASAQSWVVQGSAGPTITDSGHSLAAAVGFSPTSRLTLLFDVQRTHLFSRVTRDDHGGFSAFRGGTVTLASVELRATIRGHDRVSPYVFGGTSAGISRPNVNEIFPRPIKNQARALFFGGGIQVPLRGGMSVFADVRMVGGVEGREGMLAFAPVRAGLAWRF